MTRNAIIKMAREAGWSKNDIDSLLYIVEIVAAAKQEACAKLCESLPMQQRIDVRDQAAAAIRAMGDQT
jgi:N-acetylglucosamine kinase-like BadF-type ATPase